MTYQGVPITGEDERNRASDNQQAGNQAPDTQISMERAVIVQMDPEAVVALIEMPGGQRFTVRVRTPLAQIFMFWGDPKTLKNIPCTIFYQHHPGNGIVELGGPDLFAVREMDRAIARPFAV